MADGPAPILPPAALHSIVAMFAGVTAHFIGAPLTVAIMGAVVIVLAVLVAWRVPAIRSLES